MENLVLQSLANPEEVLNTITELDQWYAMSGKEDVRTTVRVKCTCLIKSLIKAVSAEHLNFCLIFKEAETVRGVATSFFIPLLGTSGHLSQLTAAIPVQLQVAEGIFADLAAEFSLASRTSWFPVKDSFARNMLTSLKVTLACLHKITGIEYCFICETGSKRRITRAICTDWFSPFLKEQKVTNALNLQECEETWDKFLVVSGKEREMYTRPTITLPQPKLRGKNKRDRGQAASSSAMEDDKYQQEIDDFMRVVGAGIDHTRIQRSRKKKK